MAIDSKTRVKEHYKRMKSQGYKQIKVWVKPESVEIVKKFANNPNGNDLVRGLKAEANQYMRLNHKYEDDIKTLETDLHAFKKLSTKQSEEIERLSSGGNQSKALLLEQIESLQERLASNGDGGDLASMVHPNALVAVKKYIKQQNEIASILD